MTDTGQADDVSRSVIVECDLPQPPEKVWRALTVPELLAAWLAPNDIRPEVGRRFTLQQAPPAASGAIECEVLAAEPHRLLRLRWQAAGSGGEEAGPALDSVVTFVLSRTAAGGTHLRLVHSGLAPAVQESATMLAWSAAFPVAQRAAPRHRRRCRCRGRQAAVVIRRPAWPGLRRAA